MSTKLHAKYSASGSERWLNCAGSIQLCETAPEQPPSPYAEEGTKAHACLEFLLKNRKNLKAAAKVAKETYSDEMISHALEAVEYILKRLAEHPGAELRCETRVDASPFTCEGQFGTLDAAIVEEFGKIIVFDYKYGAGVAVDPDENTQMIYYALGISNEYHHNFSDVEMVILQPRAFHESGEVVRTWQCPIEDLIAWEDRFRAGVKAAEDPLAPLSAGDWCRWCPAKPICPELKDKAMRDAAIVFSDAGDLETMPVPTMTSVRDLGKMLTACDKIETWIGAIREHAAHLLERGHEVEGWKLVPKRSIRKWTDIEAAEKSAKKLFGSLAFKTEFLSPAQLETAAKKTSDPVRDRVFSFVSNFTSSVSSGTTLVPAHDKRDAVNAIANAFADDPFLMFEGKEEHKMAKAKAKKKPAAKKKTTAKKKAKK